jgi:hypothetical protein
MQTGSQKRLWRTAKGQEADETNSDIKTGSSFHGQLLLSFTSLRAHTTKEDKETLLESGLTIAHCLSRMVFSGNPHIIGQRTPSLALFGHIRVIAASTD